MSLAYPPSMNNLRTAVNRGNRWVPLGDSLTGAPSAPGRQAADTSDGGYQLMNEQAWPTWASIIEPRLRLVNNSGKGGDTITEALARFATDVKAYRPSIVTIMLGRNDYDSTVYTGWDTTTFLRPASVADLVSIVRKVRQIGAVPVLCTCTPADRPTLPADEPKRNEAMRAWLHEYSLVNDIPLIDFAVPTMDAITGKWITGLGNDPGGADGVHPTPAGALAMATYAAPKLGALLPNWTPKLPLNEQGWGGNLITTPLISTTAGTGRPAGAGWTESQTAAITGGVTWDTVTGDANIKGNWLRCTIANATFSSGTTGTSIKAFTFTGATIIPGHRLRFVCRVDHSGFTAGVKWSALLRFSGGGLVSPAADWAYSLMTQPVTGILCFEMVVPSVATGVQLQLRVDVPQGGSGVIKYAQLGMHDLNVMGLTA